MSLLLSAWLAVLVPQEVTGADLDKILERADRLLEEAKAAYEDARTTRSVPRFLEAGFKLEDARIKYLVLQEIGAPEKQKAAAERLRAANQLAKLINDGRIAVAPRPADPPAPPAAPPAPAEPAPALVPAPKPEPGVTTPAPVDVTKRLPVPDPALQKEAGRQIRQLFKEKFAAKDPAVRKALARELIQEAARIGDDRTVQWVLYAEASEASLQAGDLKTSYEAIEGAARVFDVDAVVLKQAALSTAAKSASFPADFVALAQAYDRLADEWSAADQYDAAEKAAAAALQQAKRSKDAALTQRLTARAREVAEARAGFKAMKRALETLARHSDDPGANAEMGKFLCFTKAGWDLGLRFLAKGNDAPLRALAERELAFPGRTDELTAIGDGWWDLSLKEKTPSRKLQMQLHLKDLYEAALVDAVGIFRVRIEKRLMELEDAQIVGVDLLRFIDPKTDAVKGEWNPEGRNLVCREAAPSSLAVPYQPPEEYDLSVILRRRSGGDAIAVGLVMGGVQFNLILDGHAGEGGISGLELIDGRYTNQHPDVIRGRQVAVNQTATLLCAVRKGSVTVSLNGAKFVEWQGNPSRLALSTFYRVPNTKALVLGSWGGSIEFSRYVLTPVSGQGKRLR